MSETILERIRESEIATRMSVAAGTFLAAGAVSAFEATPNAEAANINANVNVKVTESTDDPSSLTFEFENGSNDCRSIDMVSWTADPDTDPKAQFTGGYGIAALGAHKKDTLDVPKRFEGQIMEIGYGTCGPDGKYDDNFSLDIKPGASHIEFGSSQTPTPTPVKTPVPTPQPTPTPEATPVVTPQPTPVVIETPPVVIAPTPTPEVTVPQPTPNPETACVIPATKKHESIKQAAADLVKAHCKVDKVVGPKGYPKAPKGSSYEVRYFGTNSKTAKELGLRTVKLAEGGKTPAKKSTAIATGERLPVGTKVSPIVKLVKKKH